MYPSNPAVCEPDNFNGVQDVLVIQTHNWPKGSASQWNDVNETNLLYFIIEYDFLLNTETFQSNRFKISPNPSNSFITITNSETIESVKIYDITGKLVKNIKNENNTIIENIDIKEFATGMYLLHVIDKNKKIEILKLIKN